MLEDLKELSKNELICNIVLLVVGIILTLWPDATLNLAVNIVGSIVIVFGLINLFMAMKDNFNDYLTLFIGILSVVVGIFIIVKSASVISIIHILLGIAILANGIINMKTLLSVKTDTKKWKTLFITSIIITLLGILLIFKPLFIADMIVRIGGIVMILAALEGLLIVKDVNKSIKRIDV